MLSVPEIVKSGLCIGCGLCQSIVGKEKLTLVTTPGGRERPRQIEAPNGEELALINAVCPGLFAPGPAHDQAGEFDEIWGPKEGPWLIGWAAVRGDVGPLPSILFWIVFFWQIPHFLAIAWIYRKDYADGGFCMLPAIDPDGTITGRQATLGALTLIPVSLIPSIAGMAGGWYATGAVLLGYYFLVRAVMFLRERSTQSARSLLRASLIYLPVLMALLFLDS